MAQSNRLTKEEIKQDQFIELVLKSYDFLLKHLKIIILALVVGAIAFFGYTTYHQQQKKQRTEASFALVKAFEKYQEAERSSFDPAQADESKAQLQEVATQFESIFQKYSGTSFADTSRYNYAKVLYYQGDYADARTHFKSVIEDHQQENKILALSAQKAIGDCYTQEGKYQDAINAYQKSENHQLPPNVPATFRDLVLANAKFSQALCHEKLGHPNEALPLYKDLIDLFDANLEKAIQEKSRKLIPELKTLSSETLQSTDVLEAQKLENEGQYYDALVAYAEAVHRYKVDKDIHGGLNKKLRQQIRNVETKVNDFLKNLRDARRYDTEDDRSKAIYFYDQAVGLNFAPSLNLYGKALIYRDKIETAQK
jgi:tetratricopeptide (TPR) repeat protein